MWQQSPGKAKPAYTAQVRHGDPSLPCSVSWEQGEESWSRLSSKGAELRISPSS